MSICKPPVIQLGSVGHMMKEILTHGPFYGGPFLVVIINSLFIILFRSGHSF